MGYSVATSREGIFTHGRLNGCRCNRLQQTTTAGLIVAGSMNISHANCERMAWSMSGMVSRLNQAVGPFTFSQVFGNVALSRPPSWS